MQPCHSTIRKKSHLMENHAAHYGVTALERPKTSSVLEVEYANAPAEGSWVR
jgi:hypothetical protein